MKSLERWLKRNGHRNRRKTGREEDHGNLGAARKESQQCPWLQVGAAKCPLGVAPCGALRGMRGRAEAKLQGLPVQGKPGSDISEWGSPSRTFDSEGKE